MKEFSGKVITVSVGACWDLTYKCGGVGWGEHAKVDVFTKVPAGKAMNVSRALDWMGIGSVAMGLWGSEDFDSAVRWLGREAGLVEPSFTVAEGRTRENVTVIDTAAGREMHLRAANELCDADSMSRLRADLAGRVGRGDVCVFSGSMPGGEVLDEILLMVGDCAAAGARVAIDTSGEALAKLIDAEKVWLVKPNEAELVELLGLEGYAVGEGDGLIERARTAGLMDKCECVLLSMGERGAVIAGADSAVSGAARLTVEEAVNTVGCGDFLLAGFLGSLVKGAEAREALQAGLVAGAARATEVYKRMSFDRVKGKAEIVID
jgi:1-phosphofructokinase family hexose kinase